MSNPFYYMKMNGKNRELLNLDEAWEEIIGGDNNSVSPEEIYRRVSYVYRAIEIVSSSLASLPFEITSTRTDEVIDSSADYENAVGFLPNPTGLLYIIEAALQIWAYAYLFKVTRRAVIDKMRYILPTSVKYKIDDVTGDITFTRVVNGKLYNLTPDNIVYFWKPDPFVEIGAPTASPAQAAMMAAGLKMSVNKFGNLFFERGAIKATLFAVSGTIAPVERSKFKQLLKRLSGGSDTAWSNDIINADNVTPVIIGEGIESLDNNALTDEAVREIAVAFGLSPSQFISPQGLGSGGVADQSNFDFYDKKIVPDAKFIQAVLNDQVFNKLGYRFRFLPDTLDIYQEDESKRSGALASIVSVLEKGEVADIGMEILGYEISDAARKKLEAYWRNSRAEVLEPEDDPPRPQPAPVVPEPVEEKTLEQIDIEKWKRYATKRVKSGKVPDREWESDHISDAKLGAIQGVLENCKTVDDVDNVFANVWMGYP
jgi:phage portal protein BeeE